MSGLLHPFRQMGIFLIKNLLKISSEKVKKKKKSERRRRRKKREKKKKVIHVLATVVEISQADDCSTELIRNRF